MTVAGSWRFLSEDEERAIRDGARDALASLAEQLQRGDTGPDADARRLYVSGQLLVAQAALVSAAASVGNCHCGQPLYFVGKTDGLWVECGANPPHGWKVAV